MSDLATFRKINNLPEAGSSADKSTVGKYVINGREFYGVNSKAQNPKAKITMRVNNQTKYHAEAHGGQQIIDAGLKGTAKVVDLYLDRKPCTSCGENNGLGSICREIGAEQINVYYPGGSEVFTPPKTKK